MSITGAKTILLLVRFKVYGIMRYLSHAETLKLFQRACVRAGVVMRYSQGFNPRPKLSLPLPRSVGVDSDDELLLVHLEPPAALLDCSNLKLKLSAQVPQGFEIVTLDVAEGRTSFQPSLVTYIFTLAPAYPGDKLRNRIKRILQSETLPLCRSRVRRPIRKSGADSVYSVTRTVDVRRFLQSINVDDSACRNRTARQDIGFRVIVVCKVAPAGSIRVDEIMKLLELDYDNLAEPIKRTDVKWLVA